MKKEQAMPPAMKIEMRPVDALIPYENNPRYNDDSVDDVAASIRDFGWRQPIVVDKDGVIVEGHTRLKAAKQLGLEFVPVHVADDLSDEKIMALRLADNKTAEKSSWDYGKLDAELASISDAGIDMADYGFDEVDGGPDAVELALDADDAVEDARNADGVGPEGALYLLSIRIPVKHKKAVEKYRRKNGDGDFTKAILAIVGVGE